MTTDAVVRVVLADDNPLIRMGIRALLSTEESIDLVGEAGDGLEAETLIRELAPDVALLDVRMPGQDGVTVAATVPSSTHVLMLTYSEAPSIVTSAVAAGAVGYLVHGQFDAMDLVFAVQSAARGHGTFSAPAMAALTAPPVPPEPLSPAGSPGRGRQFGLSAREEEVTDLIAQGRTNGEIAKALFLSEKTVKNHINRIFAKLGVQTRAQATAFWLTGELNQGPRIGSS